MEQEPELVSLSMLHEHVFRSKTPVVGPLIVRFRSAWHSVAGRWADRTIIGQQTTFNRVVARQVDELDHRLILSDHDLTDLVGTVAELTQQVIQLQQVVAAFQARADHSLDQRE